VEITRRTDYAIRILIELARRGADAPLSVKAIAVAQEVPYAFARGIQRDLVAAGLVVSKRGATGGIALARPAAQISMLQIVEAIQGKVSVSVCSNDPGWCSRMGGCSVHKVWCEADRLVSAHLASHDLATLASAEEREERVG